MILKIENLCFNWRHCAHKVSNNFRVIDQIYVNSRKRFFTIKKFPNIKSNCQCMWMEYHRDISTASRCMMWMGTTSMITARNGINYLFAGISVCLLFEFSFLSLNSWDQSTLFFPFIRIKNVKTWKNSFSMFWFRLRMNALMKCTHTFFIRSLSDWVLQKHHTKVERENQPALN